jgi:hypothetical protein
VRYEVQVLCVDGVVKLLEFLGDTPLGPPVTTTSPFQTHLPEGASCIEDLG